MSSALPENTANFRIDEIAAITGGTLTGAGSGVVTGVVTDTRTATLGKLFVALVGDRYDGHDFVHAALRGGARALLVERDIGDAPVPVVRVGSTLRALGALAREHRTRWGGHLVAVVGSAGKTTTRGAIAAALDAVAPGAAHFAAGNLNNAIGVPLVLFGLGAHHRYAVAEIGTNAPGEVAELARIAQPNTGVLTLVGLEHTAGLGSLDAIEDEEGSLFAELPREGIAIGNVDDERVRRQLARARAERRLGYGFSEGATYRVLERSEGTVGSTTVVVARPSSAPLRVVSPLLGRPGAAALAAAIAVAENAAGRPLESGELEAAFARVRAVEPGRLTPIELANGALVLDDTYNSNPASLASSVAVASELARARGGRLFLVLGEMRELGERSPTLHREAGEALTGFGATAAVALGGDARWLLEPLAHAGVETRLLPDVAAAGSWLAKVLAARDVALVKASRGVRAERVIDVVRARLGRGA
ncbi:MAG: UDP-N-acetylmuramoyl-tripeptide--D-alanyl-D-alanine ligase [Pseudomonadota bacterium]|nr:MAG: UDP-N-acetylmuramoylalanyl-D-glutamyl-2, 6-diaminopimelate--D-alanyl-D-alanine ligase [Pseudomonadota bacterium]